MDNKFELVVCIVNAGFSQNVMAAARKAGARGGTILRGRGSANPEAEEFFGLTIQPANTPSVRTARNKVLILFMDVLFIGYFVFQKAKTTARMMQAKLTRWFQRMGSPLKTVATMTVKTSSETHSWMTFSSISEKGPPVICEPMRLAGIMNEYSKKAMPHERAMMPMSGQSLMTFICCSFRLPYQAKVMKTLLTMSIKIVINPLGIFLRILFQSELFLNQIVKDCKRKATAGWLLLKSFTI